MLVLAVVVVDMVLGPGWDCSYCEGNCFLLCEAQSGQLFTLYVMAASCLQWIPVLKGTADRLGS